VVLSNTSVPGGTSDLSGNCTLAYLQGWPNWLIIDHVGFISDSQNPLSSGATYSGGPIYSRNNVIRDSYFLGGGWVIINGGIQEGTKTETFGWNVTSMTADHLVFPTRTNTLYTEYGNNSGYPDSAGCTGSGCNPPQTMYFPATAYCESSTANPNCMGFVGVTSPTRTSMPLTLSNYHGFALRSDSSFYAGASDGASDGKSMGPDVSAIDTAQKRTTFVCPYVCGSPGPYPD
jgi:hypothetical protein